MPPNSAGGGQMMRRAFNEWSGDLAAARDALATAAAWHDTFEDVWRRGGFVPGGKQELPLAEIFI